MFSGLVWWNLQHSSSSRDQRIRPRLSTRLLARLASKNSSLVTGVSALAEKSFFPTVATISSKKKTRFRRKVRTSEAFTGTYVTGYWGESVQWWHHTQQTDELQRESSSLRDAIKKSHLFGNLHKGRRHKLCCKMFTQGVFVWIQYISCEIVRGKGKWYVS